MSGMEIDWGAASFESGEDERARREREAMESLSRRLAERDEQRGLVPTPSAVFPEDIAPPIAEPTAPLPQPPSMLAPPMPGDLGPQSPIPSSAPSDPGPPAISTSPQPPEPTAEASTNPEASTTTAGAHAAQLRRQAQQQRPAPGSVDALMAQERERMEAENAAIERQKRIGTAMINAGGPTDAPTAALGGPTGLAIDRTRPLAPMGGETGLEGGQPFARDSMARAAMEAERAEPTFDERRQMAREEDTRRRRIRAILMGLAAIAGVGTARGGGAGALLGAIPAAMVRRPDEEETLLEADAREREMGAQEAEQASVTERLRLQREQAEREEIARLQRLGLDTRRFESQAADRTRRTDIAERADQREANMVDPASGESIGRREMVRRYFTTLPAEMQSSIEAAGGVEGLNANDASEYAELIRSNLNARVMSPRSQNANPSGVAGGVQGVERVPAALIAAQAQLNGEDPQNPSRNTVIAAQRNWDQMEPRDRAELALDSNAQNAARILSRHLEGYEQAQGGAISQEQHDEARQALRDQREFDAAINQAVEAADRIENMSGGRQALVRGGDLVGVEADDAVSDFNDARTSIISTMNRMAGGGTMDQAEFARWQQQLPSISDFRSLAGATRRLRAAQRRVAELTRIRVEGAGYRRTDSAPSQRQAPASRGTRIRFRDRDGNVRRTRPVTDEAAARRIIESAGGTVL